MIEIGEFTPLPVHQRTIAEVHYYTTGNRNYEWAFEGDITACFRRDRQHRFGGAV